LELSTRRQHPRPKGLYVSTVRIPFQPNSPHATVVADLTRGDVVSPRIFDCIISTQTLQFIYYVCSAIETLHRILKPGGVVLAAVGGDQSDQSLGHGSLGPLLELHNAISAVPL
jgi:hypothetical protein